MNQSFGELNIQAYTPHHPEGVTRTRLFDHEELRAELVTMPPGTEISMHVHEHAHELFDVIAGQGQIIVDGQELFGGPGKCVLVKAGTPHGLRNDTDQALDRAHHLPGTHLRPPGRQACWPGGAQAVGIGDIIRNS